MSLVAVLLAQLQRQAADLVVVHLDPVSRGRAAEASKAAYEKSLAAAGYGAISTEIREAGPFYYAEDYHQQYLAKNPGGYCGLGGTGVSCR